MPKSLTKVEFTNPDKILYPKPRITKRQVIEYYIRMAPKMLSILADRPAVLNRFPDGVEQEGFYEKDVPAGTPSWVQTFRRYSETAERDVDYTVCKDLDTLLWLANLAALEIHITLSRRDSFESPDLVLIDIDPEPPASYSDAIDVALLLKEKLDSFGLRSYVKTSGLKGIHIVIPVRRGYTFRQTREFAHDLGKSLAKESTIVVSEFPRSRDPGTVFVDYLQNSHGRTMVCPYSLRATPTATVSTPLEWKEIKKVLDPEAFNIFSTVKIRKEPWQDLLKERQKLMVN